MEPDARSERDEWGSFGKQAALALAYRLAARHAERVRGVPHRILVVDLDNIGDVLLATPAIRALRRCFPEAVLDVLVTDYAAPVLRGNSHVDDILTCGRGIVAASLWERPSLAWRIRRRQYDLGVVLEAHWGYAGFPHLLLTLGGVPIRLGRDLDKH